MNKRITFRHMEHSNPMEDYANQQLEKIENILSNERTPIYIDLVLEPSKVHAHHHIELRVKTPRFEKISDFEGPDFYNVLDRVIDTMYRQICEEKKKEIDERKQRGRHDEFKKQR